MRFNSYSCPTCEKAGGITPGYAIPKESKYFYCGYCKKKYKTNKLKPIHSFVLGSFRD